MKCAVFSVTVGGMLGAGVLVPAMTNTREVRGWAVTFGDRDPTLTFVPTGAIIPTAFARNGAARRAPLGPGLCVAGQVGGATRRQSRAGVADARRRLGPRRPAPRARNRLDQLGRRRRFDLSVRHADGYV